MTKSPFLDQRYYHISVMGPQVAWTIKDLWSSVPGIGKGRTKGFRSKAISVEYKTISTASFPGRGEPPPSAVTSTGHFISDIFGIELTIKNDRFVALGVPYIEIGRQVTLALREKGFLREVEFLKVNLKELIAVIRDDAATGGGLSLMRISARVDNDPDVTGFSIAGENAVHSDLFGSLWKRLEANSSVKRCLIKHAGGSGRLSMSCDSFGNFRMWIRKDADKIDLFGELLEGLIASGTTASSASIPYLRAKRHDEIEED